MKRWIVAILLLLAAALASAQTLGQMAGAELDDLVDRLEAVEAAVGSGQIPADLEGRVQALENTLAAQEARLVKIETALKKPILANGQNANLGQLGPAPDLMLTVGTIVDCNDGTDRICYASGNQ